MGIVKAFGLERDPRNMDFIKDTNDLAGADMASSGHFLERKVLTLSLIHI